MRCALNTQPLSACVEQILLSRLECPVCMEYMKPSITLCANGHNICNICKQIILHCPTCRQQFLNTRNVALEKLARQVKCPCTYRKYDCREVFYAFWLANTKANVNTLHRLARHLNWLLEFAFGQVVREIWRHTWRRHTSTYVSISLVVVHLQLSVTPPTKCCEVILAFNNVFNFRCENKYGIISAILQYIGRAEEAAKYKYIVEFFKDAPSEYLAVSRWSRSNLEDLKEVHLFWKVLESVSWQARKFSKRGRWNDILFMEIIRVGEN